MMRTKEADGCNLYHVLALPRACSTQALAATAAHANSSDLRPCSGLRRYADGKDAEAGQKRLTAR